MQTTTFRDNFWRKLRFQNVLNYGNMLIQGDMENIFVCFQFQKKTVKGGRWVVLRYVRDWLQLFHIKSQEDKL